MERLADAVNVGQVFGLDLRVNDLIGVGGIGLGVETEAFDPLTAELELQPPHVHLSIVAVAVALLEEQWVPFDMLLLGLHGLVVDTASDRGLADLVAVDLAVDAVAAYLGMHALDE